MKLFGLILAMLVFFSLIILLIGYAFFIFSKRYATADRVFKLLILHSFLSFMLLTWSIIMTIQSYDIGLDSSLNNSLIGIAILFFVVVIGVLDQFLFKHIQTTYSKWFDRAMRKCGTFCLMIWFSINSYLFYLELYQFCILNLLSI